MNLMWKNYQYKIVTIFCSLLDPMRRENQKNPTYQILERINSDPVIDTHLIGSPYVLYVNIW